MNWQEVIAQNQTIGNAQPSVAPANNFTKYMPLIFNANSPEGVAASFVLGDVLNKIYGRHKDKANAAIGKRTDADLSGVTSNPYGSNVSSSVPVNDIAAKLRMQRPTEASPNMVLGNYLNAQSVENGRVNGGEDRFKQWVVNSGLTGEKKYLVDNLQQAKDEWQKGYDSGNQGRMDEAARRANEIRQMAASRNIDLTGYDADTSLADFKQHYAADSRATLDSVRNQMSSGDYYNLAVDKAMANGMTRRDAERYAANKAREYQNGLMRQYQSAFNDYGYSGDGQLSRAGIELANLMSGENGKEQVQNLFSANLKPGQVVQMNEKAKADAREQQVKLLQEQMRNQATINAAMIRASGGGGRGGRVGTGNSGSGGSSGNQNIYGLNTMSDKDRQAMISSYDTTTNKNYENAIGEDGELIDRTAYEKARVSEKNSFKLTHQLDVPPQSLPEFWSKVTFMMEGKDRLGNRLYSPQEAALIAYRYTMMMQNAGVDLDGQTPQEIYNDVLNDNMSKGDEVFIEQEKQRRAQEQEERTASAKRLTEYSKHNTDNDTNDSYFEHPKFRDPD